MSYWQLDVFRFVKSLRRLPTHYTFVYLPRLSLETCTWSAVSKRDAELCPAPCGGFGISTLPFQLNVQDGI